MLAAARPKRIVLNTHGKGCRSMNRKLVLGVAVGLVAAQLWAQDKTPKKIELKSNGDKAAYAIGALTAQGIRQSLELQGIEVDADTMLRGFRDGISGGKLALSQDDMNEALQAQGQEVAKRNAEEGDAFLEANKKKKDVVTLPSGLQYKIVKKGSGKAPSPRDVVSVHYRGRLLNGKEFVNTYTNKEPYAVAMGQVIEGWKEALALMPVGSKWELFIPPDLAFGPMGTETIPPNATVVYELELAGIAKPTAPAGALPPPRGKPQAPEDVK
jgi:FKBP-type peptidyl-prolyl cis-trans isomerase